MFNTKINNTHTQHTNIQVNFTLKSYGITGILLVIQQYDHIITLKHIVLNNLSINQSSSSIIRITPQQPYVGKLLFPRISLDKQEVLSRATASTISKASKPRILKVLLSRKVFNFKSRGSISSFEQIANDRVAGRSDRIAGRCYHKKSIWSIILVSLHANKNSPFRALYSTKIKKSIWSIILHAKVHLEHHTPRKHAHKFSHAIRKSSSRQYQET